MQLVQTLTRLGEPLTSARTRWMFGFQRRLVRRWECDTDIPHEGPLPHTSQTDAMTYSCEELLRVGPKPWAPGPSPDSQERLSADSGNHLRMGSRSGRYRASRGPGPQVGGAVTMSACPRSNGSTR